MSKSIKSIVGKIAVFVFDLYEMGKRMKSVTTEMGRLQFGSSSLRKSMEVWSIEIEVWLLHLGGINVSCESSIRKSQFEGCRDLQYGRNYRKMIIWHWILSVFVGLGRIAWIPVRS